MKQLACNECDLLIKIPELVHGYKAICPRCDFVITRFRERFRTKLLALSFSSLVFLALTLMFPFLIFTAQGRERTVYFLQSLKGMGEDTYFIVVLFMIITTIVVPVALMVGISFVVVSSRLSIGLPTSRRILKLIFQLQAWNMAEIFLLGILVSMVKIASLASVEFGWSFVAFVLYIATMAAMRIYMDKYQLWRIVSPTREAR